MNLTSIPASIILLVMTAYLCIYIYRKDTIEKEPISLLAILFIAGMVCFGVAAVLENVLVGGVDQLFSPFISFSGDGMKFYTSENIRIAHLLACSVVLAILEETIRGLALCLITHKNKNFNYTFDGMVYAVILYLGFGLVEAFRYISSGGFGSVLLRAICCIPAHLFLGVIMGCFYTGWHKKSVEKKKMDKKGSKVPSYLLVPILIHTIYTFFNLYASFSGGHLYEIVTVILAILGVVIIRKKAAKDTAIAMVLCVMVLSGVLMPARLEAVEKNSPYKKYNNFYYNQLSENGMCVYNFMKAEVPKGSLSGTISLAGRVTDWLDIRRATYAFHLENPKYYWMRGHYTNASVFGSQDVKMDIHFGTFDYWGQTLEKKKQQNKLNSAVKTIAKEAKKKKYKIEQIEYVHDWIINHCEYDHDRLRSCERTIHDPFDELIYSAYGCLVQRKCVCAGYAKAFQMVMQELGISCDYVTGEAGNDPKNMGSHAWNCITLNGQKYWIDLTWDDLDQAGKNNDDCHTYCMRTTKAMSKTHKAEDDYGNFKYPVAKGTKYSYYALHKYVLKEYSSSKLDAILAKQKNKALKEVHFATPQVYKKALKSIQNGDFRPTNTFGSGSRYWYWHKDNFSDMYFMKQ